MLRKILFQQQDKKQLYIALFGALLGFTFLIASVHYLVKVNDYGKESDMLGANTIIAQKKVDAGILIGLGKTDFSASEIENLKKESFIDDVDPILSNNFDVSFQTNDKQVPYFRTDIFVQTINPEFLDVKSDRWKWKEGDNFVPIILPRDFLMMMNTYMASLKIPPISEQLAMEVNFQFMLKKGDKKEYFDSKVVGFTNEIGSVLVPKEFMDYGNIQYQKAEKMEITQLAIRSKEGAFGELEKFMDEHGWESKNSQLIIGRLKSIVNILLSIILTISSIAVLSSCLVLLQYAQLLISRNAYAIRTLLRMGYTPATVIKQFQRYFIRLFGVTTLLAYALFTLVKWFIDQTLSDSGLVLNTSHTVLAPLLIILTFVLFSFLSYWNAKKQIFKEY